MEKYRKCTQPRDKKANNKILTVRILLFKITQTQKCYSKKCFSTKEKCFSKTQKKFSQITFFT